MALKGGTKVARHGSDGGSMPKHNATNMHKSMGTMPSTPSNTNRAGSATSHAAGKPVSHEGGGAGKANKAPKERCYAQGPSKNRK
jgi:hypothetical protein